MAEIFPVLKSPMMSSARSSMVATLTTFLSAIYLWPTLHFKEVYQAASTTETKIEIVRPSTVNMQRLHRAIKWQWRMTSLSQGMQVIEFQKRGLPHAHLLIILADHDRTSTEESIDSLVSAELPPDPNSTDNPEKKVLPSCICNYVTNLNSWLNQKWHEIEWLT